jgi:hypothetical protein
MNPGNTAAAGTECGPNIERPAKLIPSGTIFLPDITAEVGSLPAALAIA